MLLFLSGLGAIPADEVTTMPGFAAGPYPFKIYSGFLNVTFSPPINGYDGAHIHYQLHTSQRSASDPVVAWHTGGPGGSSIYGQYAEVGYFQVSTSAGETINKQSWNLVANMLYLESPAGSFLTPVDQHSGFSYCTKAGVRQTACSWDDKTQAEAYGHTLTAFYAAYPELKPNELYLAGESYAGQYIPNIAAHLLDALPEIPLKGIAVGNGCWGGDADHVSCNGPDSDANDVELYHGKGLISTKLYAQIQKTCAFPKGGLACDLLLAEMDKAVGPHNVYNVYDNCQSLDATRQSVRAWHDHTGKSTRWLRRYLASNMANPAVYDELDRMGRAAANTSATVANPPSGGGYDWTCGQFEAIPRYFKRKDVRAALHLPDEKVTGSSFEYRSSGPASITLYPKLIKALRVLIYNGDADSCVPYIGNEQWTTSMVSAGVVTETKAWHPWYEAKSSAAPCGYATSYSDNFQFVTLRLAGHQVPKNAPGPALTMITAFLDGKDL